MGTDLYRFQHIYYPFSQIKRHWLQTSKTKHSHAEAPASRPFSPFFHRAPFSSEVELRPWHSEPTKTIRQPGVRQPGA